MSTINGKPISSTEVPVGENYAKNWELIFGKDKKENKPCLKESERMQ